MGAEWGVPRAEQYPSWVKESHLDRAVHGLHRWRPELSARRVFTPLQAGALLAALAVVMGGAVLWPEAGWKGFVCVMSLGFVASLVTRCVLAASGQKDKAEALPANDWSHPVYSVIVPLYREAAIVPQLLASLGALDYPSAKLDLLLVVEEDDDETRAALAPYDVPVIAVPKGGPRTKPKAVNFAAQFARGEFLVIFDAEDRPEPDQLKKAVAAFRQKPDICCFQARLVIDRAANWLQHLFALDYGIWFGVLLPGLARLGAPIPLGGTSNHFRRSVLFAAGLWDPHNVTEDADLGLRLARFGHRTGVLSSATCEEAPERCDVWLRQRTRWLKGYMQTLLVHTREPVRFFAETGFAGLFTLIMIMGEAISSALLNPLLLVLCFGTVLLGSAQAQPGDGLHLLALTAGASLMIVNLLLAALGAVRCKAALPSPFLLAYPLCWLLVSLAAYRALWQLLRDPFRWEKTPHGPAG